MVSLEDLPNEILVKIFGYLSIKELFQCGQVSHRLRKLSKEKSFWKKIYVLGQVIPEKCMEQIIRNNVKSLGLYGCTVPPVNSQFLKDHELDLRHLSISDGCNGNDDFLASLVACSQSLEKLDLSESRFDLVSKCIENIPKQNFIKSIDLSAILPDLDFKSVQTIVDNCRELSEISFYGTCLSSDSIDYICNNLSEKVISIDFSAESVTDDNITALVQRCNRLEHLNLCDTDVTYSGVIEIIETLSNSLINLSLPQEVGLELGLHEMPDMEVDGRL